MRTLLALLAVVGAGTAGEEGFQKLEGFTYVFAKEGVDASKTFLAEGNVVRCTGRPYGYMVTKKSYREFTLRFDWKYTRPKDLRDDADFKGNSGYLLFVTKDEVWPRSIEVQGMNRDVAGIIPIKTKAKFTTDAEARKKARKAVGEWNTMEIVVKGGTIRASIIGTLISTVTEYEPKEGRIGFQSEGAEISWRNLSLREEKKE